MARVECSSVDAADARSGCWIELIACFAHVNANIILVQILTGIAVGLIQALPQNQLIVGVIALHAKSKSIGFDAANRQREAQSIDAFLLHSTLSYLLTMTCVIQIVLGLALFAVACGEVVDSAVESGVCADAEAELLEGGAAGKRRYCLQAGSVDEIVALMASKAIACSLIVVVTEHRYINTRVTFRRKHLSLGANNWYALLILKQKS